MRALEGGWGGGQQGRKAPAQPGFVPCMYDCALFCFWLAGFSSISLYNTTMIT
jgi:hypothetical protein